MARHFFITGAARSGTTLLDKLTHGLPGVIAASQPFFQWYADCRNSFFHAHPSFREPLPLHHHFPAKRGWQMAFGEFLETALLTAEEANTQLSRAMTAAGRATPPLDLEPVHSPQSWFLLWKHLHKQLGALDQTSTIYQLGSKEIYCEDFVPYFVRHGIRCIIVVRDVRDVITSMNHGRYLQATGKPYPLLLNIRNWRKSVATALAMKNEPLFKLMRYEDVVADPSATLKILADFFDISASHIPRLDQLHDQEGRVWTGNSSFDFHGGISPASVSRWRTSLPQEVVPLIEFLAGPELQALGYELTAQSSDLASAWSVWRPIDDRARAEYLAGHKLDDENMTLEIRRRASLDSEPSANDEIWFLYPDAANVLRKRSNGAPS